VRLAARASTGRPHRPDPFKKVESKLGEHRTATIDWKITFHRIEKDQ
jgi:hypothetical protein